MISEQALANVGNKETLFGFLRDYLHWPVHPEDTFTYTGPQLHGAAAARVEVSQIVPFTSNDPFLIMLADFQSGFRRSDLREALRAIRAEARTRARYSGKNLDQIVFVCATEGYRGVRFAHFKEQDGRQPRVSVFGWDNDQVQETRTLRDVNLPALTMPPMNLLGEPDWSQSEDTWYGAWDVEKVTRDFFRDYREVFEKVEAMVSGVKGDKRLFTQRLFNRLLFVQFLQKKRWLKFNGSTNYLPSLLEAAKTGNEDFYRDRLYWLFFYGLGTLTDSEHDSAEMMNAPVPTERRGEVPYLNGGLFEMEDADDIRGAVSIPNDAFELIIHGLFERYNFTITESTPLDVEVAVDPEMLGRVFEELVTGRHESGSYYTPKPIVSFMCREALKGYIESALPSEPEDGIQRFVDAHNPDGLRDPECVLAALQRVRACDPACGSGAYLLGMLHELLDLRACLFATQNLDAITVYERKLEIIQDSLYGVDIDLFAVNVARLRLWLSLVVEYEGYPPPPLPNLDFKIERENSLTAPDPSGGIQPDMFRRQQIADFLKLKEAYMVAHSQDKPDLRERIDELKAEIADWAHQGTSVSGFDWQVEFAEVMSDGGFDIVLANPPYIRQELVGDQKPALKNVYKELYCGTADLYIYFYYRALQLIRPGGMLAFITSNKWFRAGYGEKLRTHVAATCLVVSITDFGELPVFRAGTFPMIFIAQKGVNKATATTFTQVKSLEPPYPDVLTLVRSAGRPLPTGAFDGANWTMADASSAAMLQRIAQNGRPLRLCGNCRMFNGVKTGLNHAFVINNATRLALLERGQNVEELVFPYVDGDDVRRYFLKPRASYLLYIRWSDSLPANHPVMLHLRQYQQSLSLRDGVKDNGPCPWFALSRPRPESLTLFRGTKIIYPLISMEPRFTLDETGIVPSNSVYCLAIADPLYVLGVLNSSAAWEFLKNRCAVLGDQDRRGRLQLTTSVVGNLPIPDASDSDRAAIAALTRKCLDAKGVGCEAWEKEIDDRVARLYGL